MPGAKMDPMSGLPRFDHVGITVADLDTASAFFVGLGFEVEGRTTLEGEFVDKVGAGLELARFIRPDHQPGSPAAMANELGLRSVTFEVKDIPAILARLAADGYGVIGGVGEHEHIWRMAAVRGPEGIIVNLAERIGETK
jgi:catechol 2,3-dioxygenase-like lactoylglutathione lyase family enzyme